MSNPTVSVVMSVYNGERFLPETVESVLNQTFCDFEFIIINDGSADGTAEILSRYQKNDPRIVVYHQENRGQAIASNKGCSLARGCYIARTDADDVSLPERLERQVQYLEKNPHIAFVGSSVNIIDASGRQLFMVLLPSDDKVIKQRMFEMHDSFIPNQSVLIRSEVFRAFHGYRANFVPAEDYDLWLRIAERRQVSNLPEPLVNVRRRAHTLSSANLRLQVISILAAWAASLIRRSGGMDPISDETVVNRDLIRRLGVSDEVFEASLMGAYQDWIHVMIKGSDDAAALELVQEALGSEPWKHIERPALANIWLTAAGIHYRQGRPLNALASMGRAILIRPLVAGRPLKRAVNSLFRRSRTGTGQARE